MKPSTITITVDPRIKFILDKKYPNISEGLRDMINKDLFGEDESTYPDYVEVRRVGKPKKQVSEGFSTLGYKQTEFPWVNPMPQQPYTPQPIPPVTVQVAEDKPLSPREQYEQSLPNRMEEIEKEVPTMSLFEEEEVELTMEEKLKLLENQQPQDNG
jgi:hypothetical protein